MYMETRITRTSDLRFGSAVSLTVHITLILLIGSAVTHSRAHFTPPTLQTLRLDVDLPPSVAAENALMSPSASPVESAVPQVAAPPRPVMAAASEERLSPSSASLDVAPASEDSVVPRDWQAGGVTTFVATESTAKSLFGTGATGGVLDALPTGARAGRSGPGGVGIEGPISLRNGMKPLYPIGARQRGEEGTVVLETTVMPDGRASLVAVLSSSNFTDLDRAAVKAAERAVFNPATENGHTVQAQARITIIFRLTN